MTTDVVQCRKCKTPHHRTCWEYMGKCSTYACPGRASETLVAGAEEEIVFIGEAREEKNRVRAWMEQLADNRLMPMQRSCPKRGRYLLKFDRNGIAYKLEGRKGARGWKVWFHAHTKEPNAGAATVAMGIRRVDQEDGSMRLEPEREIDSYERLRGFFDACLATVDRLSRA